MSKHDRQPSSLAVQLKTWRLQNHLTQAQVATLIGKKSPSYVSDFETGFFKSLPPDVMRRIHELIKMPEQTKLESK
ncbi:MAG: helix-turn-helix domain-containing protein [Magnetococcus sp. YQC-3]